MPRYLITVSSPMKSDQSGWRIIGMTVTITAPRQKKRSHVGCFVRSR